MEVKRFFTADSHYGDSELIGLEKRPFKDAKEMDEVLVANHNRVVGKNDNVYHLGDFGKAQEASGANLLAILKRLNGNIHLIAGNHDENNVWKHRRMFASWQEYKEIIVGYQRLVLFHYPIRSWRWNRNAWHLFGHVHGNLGPWYKSFDVGVKSNNWTPLSFEQVAAKVAKLGGSAPPDMAGVPDV